MATEKEPPCQNFCSNDPNFAIICSFFDRFALTCGISPPTFSELQEMIESSPEVVSPELINLHVKLLRKIRRSVATEKWEKALVKFCHSYYCSEDGWELERCGYKKCKVPVKLRILKTLLDAQFDLNTKFKNDINKLTAEELRIEPLGKDKVGQSYWCQFDSAANVRVYKEDQDEETWKLVAEDRRGLVELITQLSSGEELLGLELINEDSNSQEVEKPIIDTGQVEVSTSEENSTDNNTISSLDNKTDNSVKQEDNSNSFSSPLYSVEGNIVKSEKNVNNKDLTIKEENKDVKFKETENLSAKDEVLPSVENLQEPRDQVINVDLIENERSNNILKTRAESLLEEVSSDVTDRNQLSNNFTLETNLSQQDDSELQRQRQIVNTKDEKLKPNKTFETSNIDVAEEIKQRSLFKSNSSNLFKGKIGKSSSGSKLDQIFGLKLDKTINTATDDDDKPKHTTITLLKNTLLKPDSDIKIDASNNDDTCSQFPVQSVNREDIFTSEETNSKRKPEESDEQPSKKKCIELEADNEVGEEIEEPVMIIKGEGSGHDCDTGNPGLDSEENGPPTNYDSKETNKQTQPARSQEVGDKSDNFNNGLTNSTCSVSDHEKSIEEQLSDLTGERLSPQQEFPLRNQNAEKNSILISNKRAEKGVRRKSLDFTDSDDNDIIPPEAKKTKVIKDTLDIFGCTDESTTQSVEEGKRCILDVDKKDLNFSLNSSSLKSCNDGTDKKSNLSLTNKLSNDDCVSLSDVKVKNDENNLEELLLNKKQLNSKELPTGEKDKPIFHQGTETSKELILKEAKGSPLTTPSTSEKDNSSNTLTKLSLNTNIDKDQQINLNINDGNNDFSSPNLHTESIEAPGETDGFHERGIKKAIQNELVPVTNETSSGLINPGCDNSITPCNDNTRSGAASMNSDINFPSIEKTKEDDGKSDIKSHQIKDMSTSEDLDKKVMDDESDGMSKSHQTKAIFSSGDLDKKVVKEKSDSTTCEKVSGENDDLLDDDNEIDDTEKKNIVTRKAPKGRRKVFTSKSKKKTKKCQENNSEVDGTVESSINEKLVEKTDDTEELVNEITDNQQGDTKTDENQQTLPNKKTKVMSKFNETKPTPIKNRKRRNSRKNIATEKESEDENNSDKKENGEVEEIGGKRRKMKGKRAPNKSLRKSVEDQRNTKSSSEEDIHPGSSEDKEPNKSADIKQKASAKKSKNSGKSGVKTKCNVLSSKIKKDDTEADNTSEEPEQTKNNKKSLKTPGRNSRAFLGIDLNIDINECGRSVRQSSRLAQIKIKEQADHKHGIDEPQKPEKSGKKSKKKKDEKEERLKGTPKKKKKAKKEESEDDIPEEELLSDKKKGRKKRKKKNPVRAFNERDPWKSSSGSSSEVEEEEEDHFDDIVEEEEERLPINLKSDHEFSPESDIEGDDEVKPIRRARTAQRVSEPQKDEGSESKDSDDFACEKCGKKDHPEWILLCDNCDQGWHASCLRPSLMLVPEGDWHCPPCQHIALVKQLQEALKIYDRDTKRRQNEELRKKRLAYVGISLDNVLPSNVHPTKEKSGTESSESSESGTESESEDSDEPVYQLRQRRQGVTSYRFNEFDDLINSAIQDEVEGKHGVYSTVPSSLEVPITPKEGEEIKMTENEDAKSHVVNKHAEKITSSTADDKVIEKIKKKEKDESGDESSEEEDENEDDEEEDEEFPSVVPKRNNLLPRPGKKKHRRLNCLDDPSDDDDGSDEDFKGVSSEDEEDEDDEDDSDDSVARGRGRSKRGHLEPVRRSSRTRRSRFDKEFINDTSDESDAPRRKKTKKLWSDSDSESDDSTWGRRKKKKNYGSSSRRKFKKGQKFTIEEELSDIETSKIPKKKRNRKIKYGGLDDLNVEELPTRRTRGKKINYQEVLGTDSDEEIQKPKNLKRAVIVDEDDFVADEVEKEEEDSGSSSGEDDDIEEEEKSSDEEEDNTDIKMKDKEEIKNQQIKLDPPPIKISPPKALIKENPFSSKRGRPPKAMIAPPPERLISEDEQYKAIVSKVSTLGHSDNTSNDKCEINLIKTVNINDNSSSSSDTKDFIEHPHHLIKMQNSSFDSKFVKRSPPIKIRSGIPVNAGGRKSPTLSSPTSESSFFPVKSPHSGVNTSDKSQFPFTVQRTLVPTQTAPQFGSASKSINPSYPNIKTENIKTENIKTENIKTENIKTENIKTENIKDEDELDNLDDGNLTGGIKDKEHFYRELLAVRELSKKIPERFAKITQKMKILAERKLGGDLLIVERSPQQGEVGNNPPSPGPSLTKTTQPDNKPTPTTQPTQPLLRVVSPLKLMANPPGPLQSTFMHSSLSPRVPIPSPPAASRMPIQMIPPQPTNMSPTMGMDDSPGKRRGRGRGKKQLAQEKTEHDISGSSGGGSVIRGMLQQPQSYPPAHYPQQYPPHPRIPFNPQRTPRPPFHPGHHPLDPSPSGGGTISVKQEPGSHTSSNPIHIPAKPSSTSAPSYHPPPHRFDGITRPNFPPQGGNIPKPQYGSYPPTPTSSTNYHYGSYPPHPPAREEPPQGYPVQQTQQYNEQFADQPTAPVAPPNSNKGFSEEDSGEFGGLVSYFSSQREDDIDT